MTSIERTAYPRFRSPANPTARLRLPGRKTYKERTVPLHEDAATALQTIIDLRKDAPERPFTDDRSGKKGGAGVRKTVSAHRFRHTFGTQLAERGAKLHTIMKVLGHSSVNMALVYTQISDQEVLRDYKTVLAPGAVIAGPAAMDIKSGVLADEAVDWLKSNFLKTELELGHCLRLPAEGPCECDLYLTCAKFVTTADYAPRLRARREVEQTLALDAADRGGAREVERHHCTADRIEKLLTDLGETLDEPTPATSDDDQAAKMLTMHVISVDEYNAFGVNTVGLQGAPFPLSISVVESEHLWTIHATAARACDLVDVLATNAHSSAAVLNLGHTSWLDDDYTPWPPSRIARQQNIAFTSHDIRWAASPRFRSDDLLVMSWQHLYRFLDGWSHHDIEIIDLPGPLEDPEADELALVINTHDDAACLLPRLPGSRVYYSGHDDCYIYAETTDSSLPTRLFARLLGLFAGAALLNDHTDTVTVPEPAESLAKALLGQSSHWVGTVLSAQPGSAVTLGLVPSTKICRMPDPIPRRAPHTITLELETGAWKLLLPSDPSQARDLSI